MSIEDDDNILEHFGWTMECQSPLEVSDENGDFARGFPAQLVIDHFRKEFENDHREKLIAAFDDINRKYGNNEINFGEYLAEIQKATDN